MICKECGGDLSEFPVGNCTTVHNGSKPEAPTICTCGMGSLKEHAKPCALAGKPIKPAKDAGALPRCPHYVAHPQSVWFERHWRPAYEKLERELALAITHDRQPYPTAEAYEKVCEALIKARAELAEATRYEVGYGRWESEQVNELKNELTQAQKELAEYKSHLGDKLTASEARVKELEELLAWVEKMRLMDARDRK